MRIRLQHPAIQRSSLELRSAGFLTGPRILLDGKPINDWRGQLVVRGDDGERVPIEMRKKWLDPVPALVLDGSTVEVATRFKWYEYLWIWFPLALGAVGGVLGAWIGFGGAYANARVFRCEQPAIVKYGLSALVAVFAALVWLVLATVVTVIIR